MTDEDRYADALHAAERKWAKRGLRPPLGTFWPAPVAKPADARRKAAETNKRVAEMSKAGMRTSEIAEALGVSRPTVSDHLRRIRAGAQLS